MGLSPERLSCAMPSFSEWMQLWQSVVLTSAGIADAKDPAYQDSLRFMVRVQRRTKRKSRNTNESLCINQETRRNNQACTLRARNFAQGNAANGSYTIRPRMPHAGPESAPP